jgi:ankyrin repeat protein
MFLHRAAILKDNLKIIKQIVDNGADLNAQINEGQTALHFASYIEDNLDVVKYLLEKRAQLNAQDNGG